MRYVEGRRHASDRRRRAWSSGGCPDDTISVTVSPFFITVSARRELVEDRALAACRCPPRWTSTLTARVLELVRLTSRSGRGRGSSSSFSCCGPVHADRHLTRRATASPGVGRLPRHVALLCRRCPAGLLAEHHRQMPVACELLLGDLATACPSAFGTVRSVETDDLHAACPCPPSGRRRVLVDDDAGRARRGRRWRRWPRAASLEGLLGGVGGEVGERSGPRPARSPRSCPRSGSRATTWSGWRWRARRTRPGCTQRGHDASWREPPRQRRRAAGLRRRSTATENWRGFSTPPQTRRRARTSTPTEPAGRVAPRARAGRNVNRSRLPGSVPAKAEALGLVAAVLDVHVGVAAALALDLDRFEGGGELEVRLDHERGVARAAGSRRSPRSARRWPAPCGPRSSWANGAA